ncbi:hypothetical protein LPJ57_011383, partial [Coemansia sp. RSA 486]
MKSASDLATRFSQQLATMAVETNNKKRKRRVANNHTNTSCDDPGTETIPGTCTLCYAAEEAVILYPCEHRTDANAQRIFQGSLVNYPLNDTGKRQADALAEALKHSKIDWILTSQFDRAIETASHVAKYHPQAVSTIDERLREISWGVADGKYIDEVDHMVDPVVDEWNAGDFDARVPEGESANECKARVVAAFADILAKVRQNKHKTVFINTHG